MDIIEHTNLDDYQRVYDLENPTHWIFYCDKCKQVYYVCKKTDVGEIIEKASILAKATNAPTLRNGDLIKCPEHPWYSLTHIQIEQYPPETDDFKQLAKMLEGV